MVAYDEAGEGGAARLWWLLRHFGHEDVAVLDGGLRIWREAEGSLETGAKEVAPGDFAATERRDDAVDVEEVLGAVGHASGSAAGNVSSDGEPGGRSERTPVLLDARAPERFRGEHEPIDPVAGHIPGARNLPFAELAPGGRFLAPEDLRARFVGAGIDPTTDTVAYCGSGVTACVLVLAATVAGLQPPRLYPGSWSEWSRRGLPAERG